MSFPIRPVWYVDLTHEDIRTLGGAHVVTDTGTFNGSYRTYGGSRQTVVDNVPHYNNAPKSVVVWLRGSYSSNPALATPLMSHQGLQGDPLSLTAKSTSSFPNYVHFDRYSNTGWSGSSSTLLNGQWRMVTWTSVDANRRTIYFDGAHVNTYSYNRTIRDDGMTITIGNSPSGSPGVGFVGDIATVGFYDRELTPQQVEDLYNAGPIRIPGWSVLESGLEVPMALAGESYFIPGDNPAHELVTTADLHYSSDSTPAPTQTTLSRNNRLATTYMVWAKWNGLPSGPAGIVAHQAGTTFTAATLNNLYLQSDGRVTIGTGAGLVSSVNVSDHFTDGLWHHYVLTVNGNVQRAYADGQFLVEATYTKNSTTLNTLNFGQYVSGSGQQIMDGEIDDSAVISRRLTDAEIADVYAAGRSVVGGYRTRPVLPTALVEKTPKGEAVRGMLDLKPYTVIDLSNRSIYVYGRGEVEEDTSTFTGSSRLYQNSRTTISDLLSSTSGPRTVLVWLKAPPEQPEFSSVVSGFDDSGSPAGHALSLVTRGPAGRQGNIYIDSFTDDNLASHSKVFDGEWHMVAWTNNWSDTSSRAVYIDGVHEYSFTAPRQAQLARGLDIGFNRANTPERDFVGEVALVAIFNQTLNHYDIGDLYALGRPRPRAVTPLI